MNLVPTEEPLYRSILVVTKNNPDLKEEATVIQEEQC